MYINILRKIKENTGIVIRFDDIAPNMNWDLMERCELLLDEFNIKPVLGVIPDNKDEDLLRYPKKNDFWKTVKNWQLKKWSIAMHGYAHVYDKETNKKDYFEHGGKSEFFDHTYEEQIAKIKKGLKIFDDNNIDIKTFFAPNHTYDLNTLLALKEAGIFQVMDGYGLMPYTFNQINFVPQLFYKLMLLPFGIQSTQIHVNYWTENDFEVFKKFIKKNHKRVISLDYAISKVNNSDLNKLSNILIKKIFKIKRLLY